MKTIAVINNKGGVGKTTTAIHLAAGMARKGRRVLLVDLDSQGSASMALGVDRSNLSPSTAEVLYNEVAISDAIRKTGTSGLHLLTGSMDLANADTFFSNDEDREKHLRDTLDTVEDAYDLIVIDCAPSTSSLTINALVAADAFIIPTSPMYLSLEGIVSLGEVVTKVRQTIGETGPVLGILVTMLDDAEDVPDSIQALRQHYGGKVFESMVRRDKALGDAPGYSETIFEFAPDSPGAQDYTAFVEEVEGRLERYGAMVERLQNQRDKSKADKAADDVSRNASDHSGDGSPTGTGAQTGTPSGPSRAKLRRR